MRACLMQANARRQHGPEKAQMDPKKGFFLHDDESDEKMSIMCYLTCTGSYATDDQIFCREK